MAVELIVVFAGAFLLYVIVRMIVTAPVRALNRKAGQTQFASKAPAVESTRARRRQGQDGQWQELANDGYWYPVDSPTLAQDSRSTYAQGKGLSASSVPAGAWMAVIAGALVAIGSLLPWLSATGPFGVSLSRNGFQLGAHDGFSIDGAIALLLGVVTIVIGIVRLTDSRPPPFIQRSAIITGAGVLLLCLIDYSSINNLAQKVIGASNGADSASVSYGFWLVAVGGLIALVSGLILRTSAPRHLVNEYPKGGQHIEIHSDDEIGRPYKELDYIFAKVRSGVVEDANYKLRELALEKGGNAVLEVTYHRHISFLSWRNPITATGLLVIAEAPG